MPEQLLAIERPGDLAQALALLARHGDRARPLAGGTSLIFSRPARTEILLDLRGIGLDEVQQDAGAVRIGAMLTLAALRRRGEGLVPTALWEAAGSAGSRVLQNQITVGGNCVQVYAWSDLPVVMLCLGARFTLQGDGGASREVPAAELYAAHPTRVLATGELLTSAAVPPREAGSGSAYIKFRRTDMDHSMASVAAQVALAGQGGAEVITGASLAAGALRGLPQALPEAAGLLAGRAPTPEALAEAGQRAGREAKVTADFRATAPYRQQLLATLVQDALELAVKRARGEA